MKRLLIICCLIAAAAFSTLIQATAEDSREAEIAAVLAGEPFQLQVWGDTAVCLAETDGVKRLIVMEKQGDAWQTVVDNPHALFQEKDWPQLWVDSDNALFWTYPLSDREIVRYHSSRGADGTWGPVDQYYADSGFGGNTYIWDTAWDRSHGGEIIHSFTIADENDNPVADPFRQYLPASWLADCISLSDFDVSRFPTMLTAADNDDSDENGLFFREAASVLMPEYTFIRGMLKNDAMHFLMEKPGGVRVYVICEYAGGRQVNLIESSPLPAGTVLGYENFSDCLRMDGRCVAIRLINQDTAGIEYIYEDAADREDAEGFLFFGDRTVWDDAEVPAQMLLYGDHPWDDITQIDWEHLPRTLEEASLRMDSAPYAMVSNPNPADRLHLRERSEKSSLSLGKYYNGTPVSVLNRDGVWMLSRIGETQSGGQRGFMKKEYLAAGQAGQPLRLDTSDMPQLSTQEAFLKVYTAPQSNLYVYHPSSAMMKVIGIIGGDWYHVWFPETGEYGFVRQSELWEGNG